MDNKKFVDKNVFYGEYTLSHWIELILRKNIVLPGYQRCFVWSKERVESFLVSLKKGCFVPPVIIGSLREGNDNENIIIDGQQRLTSILLGALGCYPKRDEFLGKSEDYVDNGDYENDDEEEDDKNNEITEWTFKKLTETGKNTIDELRKTIDIAKYEKLMEKSDSNLVELCLDKTFLDKTYLGFSYIVPKESSGEDQQRFYSTVFHDINSQGVDLLDSESRRSLYYLNKNLLPYFEPELCKQLKIFVNNKQSRYDYVRALALLSEYKKQGKEYRVAKGCRGVARFERYYQDFIDAVVYGKADTPFEQFSQVVGSSDPEEQKSKLKELNANLEKYIKELSFTSAFTTIIDADTKLFGLIYYIILCGKSLQEDKYEELNVKLEIKIKEYSADEKHKRSPNSVTYLRQRIKGSIEIYSRYINE